MVKVSKTSMICKNKKNLTYKDKANYRDIANIMIKSSIILTNI